MSWPRFVGSQASPESCGRSGWALRLRLSRAAFVTPMLGAVGMVALPRVLMGLPPNAASAALGAWLFTVFATGLWASPRVESTAPLDAWGETVLRRGLRAVWSMWSLLVVAHALFAASEQRVSSTVLVPLALVLGTRFVRREVGVWLAVATAILGAATWAPASCWLVALASAMVLTLRAYREPRVIESESPTPAASYRECAPDDRPAAETPSQPSRSAQPRLPRNADSSRERSF